MKAHAYIRRLAILLALLSGFVSAQGVSALPSDAAEESRAALAESIKELKASTSELIRLEEEKAAVAEAKLEQLRQLYAEGLVARIEVEKTVAAMADARAKVESLRLQLAESDRQLAALEAAEKLAKSQPAKTLSIATRTAGKYNTTSSLIRYTGKTSFSVAGIAGVQSFFSSTFGRPLPMSAVGQSATHDRFGYDHRHAVDVALHPDSTEGRALIDYLRQHGIPFSAFRTAIPNVATGPHIHIGRPSGRTG
jgi:hypothetical protein